MTTLYFTIFVIEAKKEIWMLHTFGLEVPYAFCRMKELQIFKFMDPKTITLILKESFRRFV